MPRTDDLIGLGMSYNEADALRMDPQLLAAAGSTQATAALVKAELVEVTGTGADGVILPAAAKIGSPYFFYNSSGSTALIYVPVGHTWNATAGTTGFSLVTHTGVIFIQYKRTFWVQIKGTAT